MTVEPKEATKEIDERTGKVVAGWLEDQSENGEAEIRWNTEKGIVEWSEWVPSLPLTSR